MKNPFHHYCDFCLILLGIGNYRTPKEIKQPHKKMMHAHSSTCPQWNDNAAQLMRLTT